MDWFSENPNSPQFRQGFAVVRRKDRLGLLRLSLRIVRALDLLRRLENPRGFPVFGGVLQVRYPPLKVTLQTLQSDFFVGVTPKHTGFR